MVSGRAYEKPILPLLAGVADSAAVENGIQALLREAGLMVGTSSCKDFPARVRELTADDPVLTSLVGSLLCVIEVMTREVETLTKRVLDEARIEPTCRWLMTAPGVRPTWRTQAGARLQGACRHRSRRRADPRRKVTTADVHDAAELGAVLPDAPGDTYGDIAYSGSKPKPLSVPGVAPRVLARHGQYGVEVERRT